MHTQTSNSWHSSTTSLENYLNENASLFRMRFIRATKFYALFHLFFGALLFIELLSFLFFFSFFARSTFLAISLAVFFLTGFVYFLSRYYFEAKKKVEFSQLKEEIKEECTHLSADQAPQERYRMTAHAMASFDSALQTLEKSYYGHGEQSHPFDLLIQKFSIWCHWKDVLLMRELLIEEGIEQAVEWIKRDPIDIQPHVLLAQLWIASYQHYLPPSQILPLAMPWTPSAYFSQAMLEKMRAAAYTALEELKILDVLSPNDPWIFSLRAAVYRDLNDPQQEIEAYERLSALQSSDSSHLFRLGKLLFEQGHAAKGLQIYRQLKGLNPHKADELIQNYSAMRVSKN